MKYSITSETVEKGKIDYENGVSANFIITSKEGEVISFTYAFFITDTKNKLSEVDNLEILQNLPFSEHHTFKNQNKLTTLEELIEFNQFDKLYYIGGSIDGMIRDRFYNPITSLVYFDSFFCSQQNISINQVIKTLDEKNIIYKKEIVYSYDDEFEDKDSVSFHYLFSQEIYNKIMKDKTYIDEFSAKKEFYKELILN